VQATDGDSFLGGQDFDNLLIGYCLAEFLKKNPGVNESSIKENSMIRLRAECTRAKLVLSSATNTNVYVPCFNGTDDLNVPVTRMKFESLCEPHFKKCIERVKGCLLQPKGQKTVEYSADGNTLLLSPGQAKMLKEAVEEINAVVLVGGSSRIHRVRQMLEELFGPGKVIEPVNADEAVSYGAGVHAAALYTPEEVASSGSLLLIDCTPLNLGIETAGGVCTEMIKAGSSIPCKQKQTFTTYTDNQSTVTIRVFEGNRAMAKDNNLIGNFDLTGILPAPRGVPQIEVTFDVDQNGTLSVCAVDQGTNRTSQVRIENTQSRLSDEDIKRMTEAARACEQIDKEIREKTDKKNGFEQSIYTVRRYVDEAKSMPQEQKDDILSKLQEQETWLQGVNGVEFDAAELESRAEMLRGLESECIKMMQGAAGAA